MKTEFEITFIKIDKNDVRSKIQKLWWTCAQERTLMKRVVFKHPESENCYARVRDEWNKITCTYKDIRSWELSIDSVKEIECEVSDFESLRQIFIHMWVKQKAYQETYRETRAIGENMHFMIDERPWLSPFVELEWEDEAIVRDFADKLWFDYQDWLFWAADEIYLKELGLAKKYINALEVITFENPPKID